MDVRFFVELQKMSRDDEMRAKLMIRGMKRILEEKKEAGVLGRFFRKKRHVQPKAWAK